MDSSKNQILFEKFDVIKVLKKDEHAAVYLAHHIYLDKKIILKILNTKTIGDKVIIDRFKREAKILAQLNSENIIKVLDFGMFKDFFYISFEYFPSQNLRQIITTNKFTIEQKEKLVVQLLKGIGIAHLNGIIHRDIKPENIFINELFELKIGDFGLAEIVNDSFATSQYSLVGTPSYMSPEQINGKQLTIQSDFFALGIVIIELFKCSNPFLGKDINESINLITKFDESKISIDYSGIPDKLQNLISNLLKRNPNDRFQNAEDALKSLGFVITKKELTSKEVRRKVNYSRKSVVLFFTVIFIVLLSGIYFLLISDYNVENVDSKNNTTKLSKSDSITLSGTSKIDNEIDLVPGEETKTEALTTKKNLSDKIVINSSIIEQRIGELFVACLPWAEIYIDGEKIETTPIKNNIKLNEGSYELKLLHPEYPEYVDSINITSSALTTFKINLDTLFGFLDCKVFPWGNIYINDTYKGETPLQNPLILEPRIYSVEIRNPQFKTIKSVVTISRGDTFRLVQNFNSGLQKYN
jgi:eukaryotic-like serine/threonine-protein kinase